MINDDDVGNTTKQLAQYCVEAIEFTCGDTLLDKTAHNTLLEQYDDDFRQFLYGSPNNKALYMTFDNTNKQILINDQTTKRSTEDKIDTQLETIYPTILIIKSRTQIDPLIPIKSQLEILIIPKGLDIDTLENLLANGMTSLLDFIATTSTSQNISQFNVESAKQRLFEVSKSIHNLNSTIDALRIAGTLDEATEDAISRGATADTYTEYIDIELLQDSKYLNHLQNLLNKWIKYCQTLKGYDPPLQDDFINEVMVWENLENVLATSSNQLKSSECKMVQQILIQGNRLRLADPILGAMEVESKLEIVTNYKSFLKSLDIEALELISGIAQLPSYLTKLSSALRRFRFSNYPITRFIKLIEHITNTFLFHTFKIIPNLFEINSSAFIDLQGQLQELFSQWDAITRECLQQIREKIRRSDVELSIPITFNQQTKNLKLALEELNTLKHQQHSLSVTLKPFFDEEQYIEHLEWLFNPIQSLINTDLFVEQKLKIIRKEYTSRLFQTGNILVEKFETSVSNTSPEDLFDEVIRYSPLVKYFPFLKIKLQDTQHLLLSSAKSALITLKQSLKQNDAMSMSLQMMGLSEISALISQYSAFNNQINTILSNVATLLGPNWKNSSESANIVNEAELLLQKTDIAKLFTFWSNNLPQYQEDLRTMSLFKVYEENENNVTRLQIKVNFNFELANIMMDLKTFLYYNYPVPKQVVYKLHEYNNASSIAIHIDESLKMFLYIIKCTKDFRFTANLLKDDIDVIWLIIKKGLSITWNDLILLTMNDNTTVMYQSLLDKAMSKLAAKFQKLAHYDIEIHHKCNWFKNSDNTENDLSKLISEIQAIVNSIIDQKWDNTKEFTALVNRHIFKILMEKISKYFKHDFFKPKTVTIILSDSKISSLPEIDDIKSSWIQDAQISLSKMTKVAILYTDSSEGSIYFTIDDIFKALERDITMLFTNIEKKYNEGQDYLRKWKSYEFLWFINEYYLQEYISNKPENGVKILDYFHTKYINFKEINQPENSTVFNFDQKDIFQIIQTKISYWIYFAIDKYSPFLNAKTQELNQSIIKQQLLLESLSSDIFDPSMPLESIENIHSSLSLKDTWNAQIGESTLVDNILRTHRFKLPSDFVPIEQLVFNFENFLQCLEKKTNYLENNREALYEHLNTQYASIKDTIFTLKNTWEETKLNMKSDELNVTIAKIEAIKQELAKATDQQTLTLEISKLILYPLPPVENISSLLAEINDFSQELTNISSFQDFLCKQLDTMWVNCNIQVLFDACKKGKTQFQSVLLPLQNTTFCIKIQDTISNILNSKNILILLKQPCIKERHWNDIFSQIKPDQFDKSLIFSLKFTLGDLLSLNLLANQTLLENVAELAQKEYVIERSLITIENTWLTTDLNYKEHRSGMVLVEEWDTTISKCNEDLSELMSMKNSSYYKLHNNRCTSLTDKLSSLSIILSTWRDVQFRWLSIFDIFGDNGQMKALLPQISTRYHFVSSELLTLFKRVPSLDHLIDITSIPRFNSSLSKILEALLTIRESLNDFLETYRQKYPRFYFLGNDELLEIIGSKNSICTVSKYARKMFGSIMDIRGKDQKIQSVQSVEGEIFYLENKVDISSCEDHSQWLNELENELKHSLLTYIEKCSEEITSTRDIISLLEKYPFQALLVSFQIYMTRTIEKTNSKTDINEILSELSLTKQKVQEELRTIDSSQSISKKIRENIVIEILYYQTVLSKLIESGSECDFKINWNYIQRLHLSKDHNTNNTLITFSQGCYSDEYGLEYIGVPERLVYTENLIKCTISLMESRSQGYGGCLFGPAGTGKTETVKMLGQNLGRVVVVFNCDDTYKFSVITRLLFGIAQVGTWSCFDEFNRLDENVLSAVASNIRLIQDSLHSGKSSVYIQNKSIMIERSTGIFITMNPSYVGRSQLPENLKNLFREFSYYKPEEITIISGLIETQGFSEDDGVSQSLLKFIKLLEKHCSKQPHYDLGLRTIKRILINCKIFAQSAVLSEEVMKSARRIILPSLIESDTLLFEKFEILCFNNTIKTEYSQVDKTFEEISSRNFMNPSTKFLLKCRQLYELRRSEQAIILLGGAGCGKTSVWKTTVDVIDRLHGTSSYIHIIDTKVLSKEELYGSLNPATLEWKDGIFTRIVRDCYTAYRDGDFNANTWIIFDGNIDPDYAETINSVLDDNKILTLPNGERIPFPPTIQLVFETDTLRFATPATVSRCSLIWIEDHVVSHYDIFIQQLSSKFSEISTESNISSSYLNSLLEIIKNTITKNLWEHLETVKYEWRAILDNNNLSSQSSLVASLVSFITTYYSILERKDDGYKQKILHKKIHQLLLTVFINEFEGGNLDNYRHTVAGYFLSDENAEELRFSQLDDELSLVPYNIPNKTLEVSDMFKTDIVITTRDTIYYSDIILDFLHSHTPLILCGPAGVGKTMIVTNLLESHNKYELVTMNFSKETSVGDVLSLFNRHLVYTPDGDGFILHPSNPEKEVVFFFDEINLPKPDKYGAQPVILFLRQLIEKGGFWRSNDGKWISLENVHFIGACNPPSYEGRVALSSQFTRHTGIAYCDYPSEKSLGHIYGTYFTALFTLLPNLKFYSHDFTNASLQVYYDYKESFDDKKFPHYIVTPRELTRLIKGLLSGILNGPRHDLFSLVKLWAHENIRIFSDRLISDEEITTFYSNLQDTMAKMFSFPNLGEIQFSDLLYSKWFSSEYMEISKKDLLNLVTQRFDTFCEEVIESSIVIHPDMIGHMLRIDRLFRQTQGHGMLVGPNRTGKTTMIKFVSWMNGLIVIQPNITSNYTLAEFDVFLRDILLKVTIEEQQICLILDESNMLETSFLERINTLLTNADIPDLFHGEELSQLETALNQKLNSLGMLNDSKDEAYKWFTNEISKNLHIFFTVSDPYKGSKMNSPALFNRCIIDWLGPWDVNTQFHIASKLLSRVPLNFLTFTSFKPSSHWVLPSAAASVYDVLINIMILFDQKFHKELENTDMSPSYFLDSISVFETVFTKAYSNLEDNQRFVRNGLDKLNESVFKMKEMKKALSEKREQLLVKEKEARTTLDTLLYQQNESERKQEATEELKRIFAVQEEQTRKKHEAIQRDIAEIQPTVAAAQLGVSNIKKQQLTELRSMNKPPEMVQTVLEAVCFLLGYDFTSWRDIQLFIRRDDFIYEIVHYDANTMMDTETRDILETHYLSRENFNFASVNRASKACGPLYQWLYAQARYAHVLQKVIPLQQDSYEAKQEMLTAKARLLAAEEMVEDLKADVDESKKRYSSLIREVEVIKTEMENVEGNLDRSELLIKSLTVENQRWMDSITTFTRESRQLIGNCLLTTVYVVYFGLLNEKQRHVFLQYLFSVMSQCSLECSSSFNFVDNNVTILERASWIDNGLPNSEFYLENFCLLLRNDTMVPYFVDPTGVVETVLQNELGSNLVTVSFLEPNYLKRLENAVRFGSTVIIEDGEMFDPAINKLLTREYQHIAGRVIVKLGGHDVDVSSDFRLFITSRDPHFVLSNFVKARVRYINFSVNEGSIEMQALRITLKEENPEILSQKEELNSVNSKYKIQLRHLEDTLLEKLNESEGNILENNELIHTLENIKKDSQNIEYKLKQTDELIELYNKTTDEYSRLTSHCTKIFMILKHICSLNWVSNIPINQFMEVFESIFNTSDSTSFNDKSDKMNYLIKTLYERTYSMLSINFDKTSKKILASLLYSAFIESVNTTNGKNWFVDIFKIISEQSKDMTEIIEDMKKNIIQDTSNDITGMFQYIEEGKFMDVFNMLQILLGPEDNLHQLIMRSSNSAVLVANESNEDGSVKFSNLSIKNHKKLITIPLGSIENTEMVEREITQNANSENVWLLLQNIQFSLKWVEDYLINEMTRISMNKTANIKILMSCNIGSVPLPYKLLEQSYKYVNESDSNVLKVVKELWFENEYDLIEGQNEGNNNGKIVPLYNQFRYLLTWLHGILISRSRLSPYGFTKRYDFNIFDYKSVLTYLKKILIEVNEIKDIASLIRFYAQDIVYGGKIDVEEDKAIVDSLCQDIFNHENEIVDLPISWSPKTTRSDLDHELSSIEEPSNFMVSWLGISHDSISIHNKEHAQQIATSILDIYSQLS